MSKAVDALPRRQFLGLGGAFAALSATAPAVVSGALAQSSSDDTAILRVAQPNSDMTFDPATVSGPPGIQGINHVFETLTALESDGTAKPLMIEEMPKLSGTGKVEVTLLPDLIFHDGSPVTAGDVVFSYERYKDPSTGSPIAAGLGLIKSVETSGDRRIIFNLQQDYAYFPLTIGIPRILPEKAFREIGADEFKLRPIGSSIFRAELITPQAGFELRRFDTYKGRRNRPAISGIKLDRVPDGSSRIAQLQSGQYDIIEEIPINLLAAVKGIPDVEVASVPSSNQINVEFDHGKPPFNDFRVRQAFMHAIDREAIKQIVFLGQAEAAHSMLAPGNPYYVKPNKTYMLDLEKAKSLLREAGYPDGVEFEFIVGSNNDYTRTMGPLIKEQLAKAGLNANIKLMDIEGGYSLVVQGKYQAFLSTYYLGQNQDPVDFYYRYTLYGENGKAFFRWTDPSSKQFNDLVDKAYLAPTFEARREGYAAAQEILAEQVPGSVPIMQLNALAAWRKNVTGYAPDPNNNSFYGGVQVRP
jgi:peptide/nickel transport system substrate-binding protein